MSTRTGLIEIIPAKPTMQNNALAKFEQLVFARLKYKASDHVIRFRLCNRLFGNSMRVLSCLEVGA
jgi:hypothetical protein